MTTKLNKPITMEFTTATNVISVLARNCERLGETATPSMLTCLDMRDADEGRKQLSSLITQLRAQGIDYRTWTPPTPLAVGGYELTEVYPDGSVQIGCTRVDRETILKVKELSDEAVSKEPEWPKWWSPNSCTLLKAESESDYGTWYDLDCDGWKPRRSDFGLMAAAHAKANEFTPIPAAEAKSILKK